MTTVTDAQNNQHSELVENVQAGIDLTPSNENSDAQIRVKAHLALSYLEDQYAFEQKMHYLYRGQVDDLAARILELEEQLEACQANQRHLTNLLSWRTKEKDQLREQIKYMEGIE